MNEKLNFDNDPIRKAVIDITILQQDIAVMGFNDSEHNDLEDLKNDILSKKISPEEGLKKAFKVKDSKQDYH